MTHYLSHIDESIKKNWRKPAITNYGASTFTYGDVAAAVERYHILFEKCGIGKGEKIAICAKNSAEWCIAFLGVVTYDAVAVPLLADFLPENIISLTEISGSRMLLLDKYVMNAFKRIEKVEAFKEFDNFCGLFNLVDFST